MDRKKLATVISAALNAPLIAILTFIPLILSQQPPNATTLILITTIFGAILPLSSTYYLVRRGIIPDIYASVRETRTEPFLWAMASYLLGVTVLLYLNAPLAVTALMACYFGNAVIMLTITLRWKISIHAVGVSGPITALVFQLGAKMIPLFFILFPVAWARVELKAHSKRQVAAGAILSGLLTWFQMVFYVNFLFPLM
ncbi:PAP2 family protein [Candidatus Bathyarchaeota archaeon]|nr:PAP2 family protein [Candidatus Bathyarchaeota archaeon]